MRISHFFRKCAPNSHQITTQITHQRPTTAGQNGMWRPNLDQMAASTRPLGCVGWPWGAWAGWDSVGGLPGPLTDHHLCSTPGVLIWRWMSTTAVQGDPKVAFVT